MSCPYCNKDGEVSALEAINKELIKMLGAFVRGSIIFRTTVAEPIDETRAAGLVEHMSRASAAAAVERLYREIENRRDLYKELYWYKAHSGLMYQYRGDER